MFNVIPITSPKSLDCGPTCLQMLLAYYGINVPLATLIEECGVRRIGCSAADLIRVGNAHGLDVKAYSCDADDVYSMDRPGIIWWKGGHFNVFSGMNDEGLPVICNPDRGRYPLARGVFGAFYSGVALTNGEAGDLPSVTPTMSEQVQNMDAQLLYTAAMTDTLLEE